MFTLLTGLGSAAGKAIKAGVAEYKRLNGDVSQGHLATVMLKKLSDWKPEHRGKLILTPALRAQFAQALAGLSYNIAAADAGRSPL